MAVGQRLRTWFAKAMNRLPVARSWYTNTWYPFAWPRADFDRLADEGYRKNAAVNICVQKLALAYQQPAIVTKDYKDNPLKDNHPVARLLARPNPMMSWHELAIFIQVYKAIGGVCRLHKVRDRPGGEVLELWPFHIGQISAVPGKETWIDHYVFDNGENHKEIAPEDIIDLKWPSVDPKQPWEALAPLISMSREVDTDSEATRYQYALLYNDAVPLTTINIKGTLNDKQFERLKAQFEMRHGGANRGRVAVTEGDATIGRMALNLEEMAFEALRYVPEARIVAGFGVPTMYSGLNVGLQQSTYNNMGEARRGFFEDTIMPQAALDDGELTQELGYEYGVTISRAWGSVVALQENADAVYTRSLNAFKGGVVMRNESRQMLGLGRVEDIPLPAGVPPYDPGFGYQFATSTPTIPAELLPPAPEKRLVAKALQRKATAGVEARIQRAVQEYLLGEYERAASEV